MTNTILILALSPLILIELVLIIYALVDLIRRDQRTVRGNNKWVWALIILLVATIGPIVYLIAGRVERGEGDNA
jgi:hypothetical protein